MRLYPPVWVTARTVDEPYEIAGFHIPKGASLLAPPYVVHRDARWWPEPDRFDPERFTEAAKAVRPRYSYFPFGGEDLRLNPAITLRPEGRVPLRMEKW